MKIKKFLFLFGMILLVGACARTPSKIFDGAYLKYRTPSGDITLNFSKAGGKFFELTITSDNSYFQQESLIKPLKKGGKVLVDKFMKTPKKKLIQLDEGIGPFWIPENMRKVGSQKGNDIVFQGVQDDAIEKWKGVEAYAVSASVFRGAVSGKWYFDVNSGFLVGCRTKTVMTDMFIAGDTPTAILIDTNIEGVALPGRRARVGAKRQPVKAKKAAKALRPNEDGVKIDGIMASGGERIVMINGEIYKVGDLIRGDKIVEILSDKVTMSSGKTYGIE